MSKREYLIIQPNRPTAEEYARGARLIPSMLDEGVYVWRVPALPEGATDGTETTRRETAKGDAGKGR